MDNKNIMNIKIDCREKMENLTLSDSANTMRTAQRKTTNEVPSVEIDRNNPAYWAEIFKKQTAVPPQNNGEIMEVEEKEAEGKEEEEKDRQNWIRQRREEGRMREDRKRETSRGACREERNRTRSRGERGETSRNRSRERFGSKEERRERNSNARERFKSRGNNIKRGNIRGRGRGRDGRRGDSQNVRAANRGRGRRAISNTQQPNQAGSAVVGCLQFNDISSMVEFTRQFINH
ncbi:zinc finger Ran-binding domain-containing protein 2-like [Anthonomus grandis grandis]|uniref:zinc finger Ran-binding domain-containing protein 2-like n=1 Tax=Anthonomus grandis grandis TaxID=2921223 RepID=UPI00216537E7|nr:zinc finger Ran-binding domain-containing protein 2-like [Anthonomus grandis grandis]